MTTLRPVRPPWLRGYIDRAAWVSDDTLLAVGWCLTRLEAVTAALKLDGRSIPLEASWIAYPRPDLARPLPAGRVIVIRFPFRPALSASAALAIESGRVRFTTSGLRLARVMTTPDAVGRSVDWLDPEIRAELLAFLSTTLSERPGSTRVLAVLRDVLRAPLPERLIQEGEPQGAWLDAVIRIDPSSFYLRGWAHAGAAGPARLSVVTPEGQRVDLEHPFRHPRPDVEQSLGAKGAHTGFVAHVELPRPSFLREGWLVELTGRNGMSCQGPAPAVTVDDALALREDILKDTDLDPPPSTRLIAHHTFPALKRLQELEATRQRHEEAIAFGVPPSTPDLSIVVPLYKRIDLMEQQLAQFIDDPEIREAELVYVLDSPELAPDLRTLAVELHRLYRVPFRLVLLDRNLGFAGATNVGISLSRGRLVLLLNSDVFPAYPGWTSRMVAFYDATPPIGALGVKLLYEDDTLQHAGMYFRRSEGNPVADNQHYYKGLARCFPPANITRPVPAVTAACLLIARDLYLRLGGLRGIYVRGDYEDSDLCLRLLAAGFANWYLPDVELYHLEGQSYDWAQRARASRYNAWVHSHLWGSTIDAVMARFPA